MMRAFAILSALAIVHCTRQARPVADLIAPERGDVIQEISFIGRIRSERSSLVRAPIEGQLVKLNKSVGSAVSENEEIAVLELPKDEGRITRVIEEEGRLAQLQLRKSQAQVRLESAKREADRLERLVQTGSIAVSELEAAQVSRQLIAKEIEGLDSDRPGQ